MARVVVVLPTYNEKENIEPLVEKLSRVRAGFGHELQILFVDDGSPDGTGTAIQGVMKDHPYIQMLQRGSKRGLGTAYLDGFKYAIRSLDPSVFVQMDSDLQHPPETLVPLVDAVIRGDGDVSVGSRYIPGGSFKGLEGSRRLVSWGANWLARQVLGLSVHDTTTGFKAMNRIAVDTLLSVNVRSSGFIFQVESLYVFKQNGLRLLEVPMVFELRERGVSKMSDKEAWEFFRSVLAMRFRDYKARPAKG